MDVGENGEGSSSLYHTRMEYYTFLLNSTVHSTTQGILLEVESASVITGKRCQRCENSRVKDAEQLEVMSREQSMRKGVAEVGREEREAKFQKWDGEGMEGPIQNTQATSPAN